MVDWYVSSAVYATIAAWAATTAYTVGQFVKPTAPVFAQQMVFRCTVAGTSSGTEPTWSTAAANNSTIASGGATFTNVTGQSTYGWSAAAGTFNTVSNTLASNRAVVGDRVFLSSDHSENYTGAGGPTYSFNNATAAFGLIQIISVNRAGSVPPVASDIQNGAALTFTSPSGSGFLILEAYCNLFWQGITFTLASGLVAQLDLWFNSSATKSHYLKNCAIVLTSTLATIRITTNGVAKVTLDNTTIQFGATGQAISCTAPFDFNWINTPSAIQGATIPATLFACGTLAPPLSVICRGVDLSAITGTLCSGTTGSNGGSMKALFDSCKIASGVTRLATPANITNAGDEVELTNCFDGTNIINERYAYGGSVIIDRSVRLSGGAQDDVGNYSLKLAASTRADFQTMPLDAFWFDVENTTVGVAKTATIEVIASASLNNTDIRLQLEHMGTTGSSLASFVENLASVLSAAAALPSSSAIWTVPAVTNFYTNPGGSGDRTASIVVTTTATAGSGSVSQIVNGSQANEFWWTGGQAGREVKFDFGIPRKIIEAKWYQDSSATHGDWKWQGSSDGSSWTDIGTTFTLGGTLQTITTLSANTNFWRYYRMLQMTGLTSSGPYNREIEFNIDNLIPTVKQFLRVTFTPQAAGRVRGLVRLGKVSATVWVNPQIVVT